MRSVHPFLCLAHFNFNFFTAVKHHLSPIQHTKISLSEADINSFMLDSPVEEKRQRRVCDQAAIGIPSLSLTPAYIMLMVDHDAQLICGLKYPFPSKANWGFF